MKHLINCGSVSLPNYSIEYGSAPIVERTTWLGEGDFCHCYLVNSTYVFRFAKHAEASAAMRVENCLLPILRNHLTVEVPQVEFAGRRDDMGHAMMGYQLLLGEPLERNVLESLPSARQTVLITQMADFARQLHDLPPQFTSSCRLQILNPLTHLTSIMNRARTALWPHLADPVWQYYEDLLDLYAREPTLHTYQPALLHGDLSPEHFLADTRQVRLTGVIDFEDACIGDPAWDLIYIYEDYGPHTLKAFLERYNPRNMHLMERKIRIYQQLNNVEYCLWMLSSRDEGQIREAMTILEDQAITGEGM